MPTNVPENPSPSNAGLTKMRLTTLTDYALRVLIYTGAHSERLCTISEIAKAFDISQAHLMKVSQLLAQQGWITTVRGKNGGLHLSKSPRKSRWGRWCAALNPTSTSSNAWGPTTTAG